MRRLSSVVCLIYKYAHPLIPSAMRVNRSPFLSCALDFDAILTRGYGIVSILAVLDKVRMAIEVLVLYKRSCMFRYAGRQHV